jgi:alpha-tubulin suppressor-like RCC1 family protein
LVTFDGRVFSCGNGSYGQLGNGDIFNSPTWKELTLLSQPALFVAAGDAHSFVVMSSGECVAFGANAYGQLGSGSLSTVLAPTRVVLPPDVRVVNVATGLRHTLFLSSEGRVLATGANEHGQCGVGTPHRDLTVPHLLPATAWRLPLDCQAQDSSLNASGLGSMDFTLSADFASPTASEARPGGSFLLGGSAAASTGEVRAVQVSAGGTHSLVLTTLGHVFSFGCGRDGRLGIQRGDYDDRSAPTFARTLRNKTIHCISAGETHSVVVSSKREVYSFGWSACGRLGLGDDVGLDESVPRCVGRL